MDYKEKYLKYKNKYISFRNIIGGDVGIWKGKWDTDWVSDKFTGTYTGTFTDNTGKIIDVPKIKGTWTGSWNNEIFTGSYKNEDGTVPFKESKRIGEFNGEDNFEGLFYDDDGKK